MALITANGILRAYAEIGYDAIGVSFHDLVTGYDFLLKASASGSPLISANIYDQQGRLLFQPYILKKIENLRVGILGITGSGHGLGDNLEVRDWRQAVGHHLKDMGDQCELLIALSSLDKSANLELVRLFPQFDIIITAEQKTGIVPAQTAGNALLSQSGPQGKYIGKIDVTWKNGAGWSKNGPTKQQELETRIQTLEW